MPETTGDPTGLTQGLRWLGVERSIETGAQDVFFGAAPRVAHAQMDWRQLRLAIYPLVGDGDSAWPRGVMLTLAHFLESNRNCRVYRLLDPDIILPSLGETHRLNGSWQVNSAGYTLQLVARIPFGTEEERWERQAETLPKLLEMLPALATEILLTIGAEEGNFQSDALYLSLEELERDSETNLKICWQFEQALFSALGGNEWPEMRIREQLGQLLRIAGLGKHGFGTGLARVCLLRAILPGAPCAAIAIDFLPEMLATFPSDWDFQARALRNLASLNAHEDAVAQLRLRLQETKTPPSSIITVLADLLANAHRLREANEIYQLALQNCDQPSEWALPYARQLVALSESEQSIATLPLTQPAPGQFTADEIIQEALAAYAIALEAEPRNFSIHCEWLLLLLHIDPQRFWLGFAALAKEPVAIEYLRTIIGELESYDGDLTPGKEALLTASQQYPEMRCVYAEMLLLDGESARAAEQIRTARAFTKDRDGIAELERLALIAEYDGFEMRLGEIQASLQSGSIREDDLSFLEQSLDTAPHQLQIYLYLAAGYRLHQDYPSALEVLLDAREQLGDQPPLFQQLSEISWLLDERELALRYLQQGLAAHPLDLNILVALARLHLNQGEEDQARQFLLRAESLDSGHPALTRLKAFIAREMQLHSMRS